MRQEKWEKMLWDICFWAVKVCLDLCSNACPLDYGGREGSRRGSWTHLPFETTVFSCFMNCTGTLCLCEPSCPLIAKCCSRNERHSEVPQGQRNVGQEALPISGTRSYFVPLTGFGAILADFRLIPRDRLGRGREN